MRDALHIIVAGCVLHIVGGIVIAVQEIVDCSLRLRTVLSLREGVQIGLIVVDGLASIENHVVVLLTDC